MARNGVEVSRPLKDRDVIVVTTADGRRKVIGDGGGFSGAELAILHGGAQSTASRAKLEYTEDEQRRRSAAEEAYQKVKAVHDRLDAELSTLAEEAGRLRRRLSDASANWRTEASPADQARLYELESGARAKQDELEQRRERLQRALIERNRVMRETDAAARERATLDDPRYHNPRDPSRPITEREVRQHGSVAEAAEAVAEREG